MRFAATIAVALLLTGSIGPLQAATPPPSLPGPSERQTGARIGDLPRDAQIDALLKTLKETTDAKVASEAEESLGALWMRSGSATVDLMMGWVSTAMTQKNYPLALDYLDRILTLKPDYAEGWNVRATVYFLREDYSRALFDLEEVLKLEPRHFDALAGLGAVLRELGKDKEALAVFEQALAIDPHLESVQKAVADMKLKGVAGHDL
jgi:tetratricopeptide (TPR) repeat protein